MKIVVDGKEELIVPKEKRNLVLVGEMDPMDGIQIKNFQLPIFFADKK